VERAARVRQTEVRAAPPPRDGVRLGIVKRCIASRVVSDLRFLPNEATTTMPAPSRQNVSGSSVVTDGLLATGIRSAIAGNAKLSAATNRRPRRTRMPHLFVGRNPVARFGGRLAGSGNPAVSGYNQHSLKGVLQVLSRTAIRDIPAWSEQNPVGSSGVTRFGGQPQEVAATIYNRQIGRFRLVPIYKGICSVGEKETKKQKNHRRN
jgi:hypothetical protein